MPKQREKLKSKTKNVQLKVDKIFFPKPKDETTGFQKHFYEALKEKCNKMISPDISKEYLLYGKELMNKRFLELIEKEKPEFIIMWTSPDEFYLETLLKIREISPKSKLINFFGDDDLLFDNFSRYLILFLDYAIIGQKKYMDFYKKEGHKNVFFISAANTHFLKPLDLEKKYDVTLIGSLKLKKSGRADLIRFLRDKGVNIKLFGRGWYNYSDLKDIYQGVLTDQEVMKVLNQSKINLCLSRQDYGEIHMTGRIFEGGACKSFVLTEYCKEYLDFFKEGKEIVMFKDKKELLEKIDYYLRNEKEREKIAETAHKRILKEHRLDLQLDRAFKEILKKDKIVHKELPKINKKITFIYKKDLKDNQKIKDKLKDYDYVILNKGFCESLKYRKLLQAYSLEITEKPISCCDYYVYKKRLGDYLYFKTSNSLRAIDKKDFDSLLNINQLMVKKEYFLKNISKFKTAFSEDKIDFIDDKNTVFVSFPLVRIKNIKSRNYEVMAKAFSLRFLHNLYGLKSKKVELIRYLINLSRRAIMGETFLLRAITEVFINKDKRRTLLSRLSNKKKH